MSRYSKAYAHIMMRRSDSTVPLDEICGLMLRLGFDCRVRGDHHIFTMEGIEEIINLQPKNGMGKAYQVKQIRDLLLKYKLRVED